MTKYIPESGSERFTTDRSPWEFVLVGVIFLVAFVAYVLFAEGKYWEPLAAWALLGLFAIFSISSVVWTYSRKRPAISIDHKGILDNLSDFGFIPWEEVTEIAQVGTSSSPAMGLKLRNPEKFKFGDSSIESFQREFVYKGYSAIYIRGLKARPEEVMEAANYFFAISRENSRSDEREDGSPNKVI